MSFAFNPATATAADIQQARQLLATTRVKLAGQGTDVVWAHANSMLLMLNIISARLGRPRSEIVSLDGVSSDELDRVLAEAVEVAAGAVILPPALSELDAGFVTLLGFASAVVANFARLRMIEMRGPMAVRPLARAVAHEYSRFLSDMSAAATCAHALDRLMRLLPTPTVAPAQV